MDRDANRLMFVLRDTTLSLVRRGRRDLSSRQFGVLLITFLEDGPHTVRGLAKRLRVPRTGITRVLDRLETFDLVRREPDPRDRRSIVVGRTLAGTEYVAGVTKLIEAAAAEHGLGHGPLAVARKSCGARH